MAIFQGKQRDPILGFRFTVEVPDFGDVLGFSNVSGLAWETEVTTYREGNDPSTPRKLPGQTTFEDIVLQKGVAADIVFELWHAEIIRAAGGVVRRRDGKSQPVAQGQAAFRRNLSIKLFDKGNLLNEFGGTATKTWGVVNAWPSRIEYGELDASASDVLLESITLSHEGAGLIDSGLNEVL